MKPLGIIAMCIILLEQFCTLNCAESTRHRHRHRHRHRQRYRERVVLESLDNWEPNFEVLRDELSILDTYRLETGTPWNNHYSLDHDETDKQSSICTATKSAKIKEQIMTSIESSLKFYQSHMDLLPPSSDDSLGIGFLKVVDDKHGGRFQASYPLSEWMIKFCNKTVGEEKDSCTKITKGWTRHKTHSWKSAKVLRGIEPKIELVGTEKEYLWGKLNGECQTALLFKCEVPHLCNITLYDPVPKSMYFLTHQLFQRILTEQSKCESAKKLLNEQVNDQLCSKMYHEARLISQLDYPFILRDVFAEYVGFCGYMGYPNFFREDWIKAILSWQSRSEYGCFTDNNYKGEFITSDSPIVRRHTKDELRQCSESKEELCLPHFTSVSFSALAVSWDYMEENCK